MKDEKKVSPSKEEKLKTKGHRQRVRKKIGKSGLEGMADYEILEALLFYSISVKDTKPVAKELLKKFKTIEKVLHSEKDEVLDIELVGESTYILFKFIKELNNYLYKENIEENLVLNSVEKTTKYLKNSIGYMEKEVFKVLYLSTSNELIKDEILFSGTIDKSAIYPREIVKKALDYNAKSVIFSHNHPSGNVKASKSDIEITEKLKRILQPLEIKVLDHIIVSSKGYYSFLEDGMI